ncbi:hypothetical protein OK016_28830 [Vibrio chagasii]|nr:hypothetical protein [Vibrio chagasii]
MQLNEQQQVFLDKHVTALLALLDIGKHQQSRALFWCSITVL